MGSSPCNPAVSFFIWLCRFFQPFIHVWHVGAPVCLVTIAFTLPSHTLMPHLPHYVCQSVHRH